MFPDTPQPDPAVLARAARLRAGGSSWEAVAATLVIDVDQLHELIREARYEYRQLLAAARKEVSAEAAAEALFALRKELRSKDEKARRQAAEVILKLRMTELRHRPHRAGTPVAVTPLDPVKGARRAEAEQWAILLTEHTDEELARIAANVAPFLPPLDPPDSDDPGGLRVLRSPTPPTQPGGRGQESGVGADQQRAGLLTPDSCPPDPWLDDSCLLSPDSWFIRPRGASAA